MKFEKINNHQGMFEILFMSTFELKIKETKECFKKRDRQKTTRD